MRTLGIIGQGAFGSFAARKLKDHFEILITDDSHNMIELEAIAACNYVMLAVPIGAYEDVLAELKPLLTPTTVIIDICSVKCMPAEILERLLPNQPKLLTHPLFGPQSAADSLKGHRLIICPRDQNETIEEEAKAFLEGLGLEVTTMTCDEHDKLMAELQGLTFFVARVLALNGVARKEIMTPSYQRLVELADLEREHSPELFATIQLANPYALSVQNAFMATAERLIKTEQGRSE